MCDDMTGRCQRKEFSQTKFQVIKWNEGQKLLMHRGISTSGRGFGSKIFLKICTRKKRIDQPVTRQKELHEEDKD